MEKGQRTKWEHVTAQKQSNFTVTQENIKQYVLRWKHVLLKSQQTIWTTQGTYQQHLLLNSVPQLCLLNKLVEQKFLESAQQDWPFFGSLNAYLGYSWIPWFSLTASPCTIMPTQRLSSTQTQHRMSTMDVWESSEHNTPFHSISSQEKQWNLQMLIQLDNSFR